MGGWNIADAEAKDAELLAALDDMSPVMHDMAGVIKNAINENFENERAAKDAWEPLADSTIADRKRKGFADGPILQRTGSLKAAATAHQVVDSTSAEVGFDESHPYAKQHMSSEPRTKIPLRDALVLAPKHIQEADRVLVRQLKKHKG